MAKVTLLKLVSLFLSIASLLNLSQSISSCDGPCKTLDDCSGQLICIDGKCNDDPDVGTQTCSGGGGAISSCDGPCKTLDDCSGQLICINGRCNDDPDVGTHTCSGGGGGSPPPSPGGTCQPFGTLKCKGKSFPQYRCSPPVTASTRATLTNNDFDAGGDGGDPSKCDEKFHKNSELIVALSTGWYNGGSRCGRKIRITARNGRSVLAKVVDECDSINGCDEEHAHLPPCANNIVDGSSAVWNALGLDIDVGEEPVTWSDVDIVNGVDIITINHIML